MLYYIWSDPLISHYSYIQKIGNYCTTKFYSGVVIEAFHCGHSRYSNLLQIYSRTCLEIVSHCWTFQHSCPAPYSVSASNYVHQIIKFYCGCFHTTVAEFNHTFTSVRKRLQLAHFNNIFKFECLNIYIN